MAESLESRKFERKQLFDVPLPVRSRNREPSMSTGSGETGPSGTMAFSLMTKRGNRQQVRSFIYHDYYVTSITHPNIHLRLAPLNFLRTRRLQLL